MRTAIRTSLIIFFAVASAVALAAGAGSSRQPQVAPTPRVAAPLVTETEWIVGEVTARLSSLAGSTDRVTVTPAASGPDRFEVKGLASGVLTLDIATGVFDPANFVPLAKAMGIRPRAGGDLVYSNDMKAALSTPTIEALLAVNKELGLALRADPRNPPTHEAAALLMMTVAMRASDTGLDDVRPLLNRAVAHLAFASASGSRPGEEGQLARAAIEALTGRQVAAAARLQRSTARLGNPSARAWYRALMMRATGDWRIYRAAGRPSFLEQLEHARALARSWTEERAVDFWRESGSHKESSLWARAILKNVSSVELGNELAGHRLAGDMSEAAILAQHFGDPDVPHWLQERGEAGGLGPISPALWARLAESSVADAAWKYAGHVKRLPPSPENDAFPTRFAGQFEHSLVFRILATRWRKSGPEPSNDNCEELARRIDEAPFEISARAWGFAAQSCSRLGPAFPAVEARIAPWTPSGTLFDYRNRLEIMGLMPQAADADWASLRKLTFYEPGVLAFAVGKIEQREPASADYRTFRREGAYSLALLRDWRAVISARGDLREALEPARAACRLDPEECLPLIDVLRSQGQDEEAFSAAMRVFGPGHKMSVAASNEPAWIIQENARRGRLAAARDIADRAAATGSYVGLLVQARLTEREGDLAEAKHLFAQLDQAYNGKESTLFALRALAREGKTHEDIAHALSALGAPSRLMLNSGEVVPGYILDPTWFETMGPMRRVQAERMGLRPGDAITRVNGFDIENLDQFWGVLSLYDEPVIELTVRSESRPAPANLKGPFWRPSWGPITTRN